MYGGDVVAPLKTKAAPLKVWAELTKTSWMWVGILLLCLVTLIVLTPWRGEFTALERHFVTREAQLIASALSLGPAQPPSSGEQPLINMSKRLSDIPLGPNMRVSLYDPSGQIVLDRGALKHGTSIPHADLSAALLGHTSVQRITGEDAATYWAVTTPVERVNNVFAVISILSQETSEIGVFSKVSLYAFGVFCFYALLATALSRCLSKKDRAPLTTPKAQNAAAPENSFGVNPSGQEETIDKDDATAPHKPLNDANAVATTLYEHLEHESQFVADMAHEIKNPLASLRSAVNALHGARDETQRMRLMGILEHDVQRLDRLVSDISNVAGVDGALVKEQQTTFDLSAMLARLCSHLSARMEENGLSLFTDFPKTPVMIRGLEERLSQVFMNLINNAISFCEDGDSIRLWCRQRDNRILIAVEDTGPGIPEGALSKIFDRFYSERPEASFGQNSGLGLSISRQIVEAHNGVIWAENICPSKADLLSEPLGARFVVALPFEDI